ncbi:LysR family transcriptional regulator [Roseibium sp.]|uniref:LysR family transcriptional regulator n=1 Tax=Roseibium sp. TaxID=1936156 RepID=UPI003A976779
MEHWTEIRTAAHVARLGTVTAAAEALGVHRATVNRHIDVLEAALGGKLFQRHPKGFTPTDLGRELLRIADTTDEQFEELHRKAQGYSEKLQGDFIVTSIAAYAPTLIPILKGLGEKHSGLTIHFLASDSLLRLEYGEAHVAFRAGPKPENPDNVVREFEKIEIGLFAHAGYVARHGLPNGVEDFPNHRFVGSDNPEPRAPYLSWLKSNVPPECVAFRSNDVSALAEAVIQGSGIGFLNRNQAHDRADLIEIMPALPEWASMIWMVTHVDLHRSGKVQAFLEELRHFRECGDVP